MILGSLNGTSVDTTPREDGTSAGVPWAAVEHSAGEEWTNIGGPAIYRPATEAETVRVSYEVRGRRTGSAPILSVGQANVSNSGGNAVLTEVVETFTNDRVLLSVGGPVVVVTIRKHATEDWEFQVRVAYDKVIPLS